MELFDIILATSGLLGMGFAIRIGFKSNMKSIFIVLILYFISLDCIHMALRDSNLYNFFFVKFALLIPNTLFGVFIFLHTKRQIIEKSNHIQLFIFGVIMMCMMILYLFINKANYFSESYFLIKFALSVIFILSSLFLVKNTLNKDERDNYSLHLKKTERTILILFVMSLLDFLAAILHLEFSRGVYYYIVYPTYLVTVIFIGYNELLSKRACYCLSHPLSSAIPEEIVSEDIDSEEYKITLSDEKIREIILKIENYCESNPQFQRNLEINIIDFANAIEDTTKNISYVLNNHFGMNFNNYINSLRIKDAASLIKESNYPVKKICAIVGFKSISTFYTAFKKEINMTPAKYKKYNCK